MQPGEVAGLAHVGMEPRFGNKLKDKDIRKHIENCKGSLRLKKIFQNLEQQPKINDPNLEI